MPPAKQAAAVLPEQHGRAASDLFCIDPENGGKSICSPICFVLVRRTAAAVRFIIIQRYPIRRCSRRCLRHGGPAADLQKSL